MAETLLLTATTKAARYAELLPQIETLTAAEPDLTANLANTAAARHGGQHIIRPERLAGRHVKRQDKTDAGAVVAEPRPHTLPTLLATSGEIRSAAQPFMEP